MLHWAPELVHMDRITFDSDDLSEMMRKDPDAYQDIQQVTDSPYVGPRIRQRPDIKIGVMGYPEEASAELGEKIAKAAVQGTSKIILGIEAQHR